MIANWFSNLHVWFSSISSLTANIQKQLTASINKPRLGNTLCKYCSYVWITPKTAATDIKFVRLLLISDWKVYIIRRNMPHAQKCTQGFPIPCHILISKRPTLTY